MPRNSCYLAIYDVSKDRERDHVAGVLEGYGLRVQKSAFECRMTRSGLSRLIKELEALDLKTGFVYIYGLGQKFDRRNTGTLPSEPFAEEKHSYVVD
jgi:CRISPR-associated protein Cas2